MPTLTTAVFARDGREFALPGLQYLMGSEVPEPDAGDPIATTWRAMLLASALRAKLTWREFPTSDAEPWTIDVPTAVGTIENRHFAHGDCRAWFFSGPEFDALREVT